MKTVVLIKLPLCTYERFPHLCEHKGGQSMLENLYWIVDYTEHSFFLICELGATKLKPFKYFVPLHSLNCCALCLRRVAVHHVKVKPRCAVLTMLKRLDKIRFRGPRTRDDFPDLAESPPASDNECSEDVQPKPRTALRDTEDLLRDPVSVEPFLLLPVFFLFFVFFCRFKLVCLFFL